MTKLFHLIGSTVGVTLSGLVGVKAMMHFHPAVVYESIQGISKIQISYCMEGKAQKRNSEVEEVGIIPEKELEEKILECADKSPLYLLSSSFEGWRILRNIRKEIKKDYLYRSPPPSPLLKDKPSYFDRA